MREANQVSPKAIIIIWCYMHVVGPRIILFFVLEFPSHIHWSPF
jgi:hypothetical protein